MRIGEECPDQSRAFLDPPQGADGLGFEVLLAGDAGLADAIVVKSARGAVLISRPVRFPGPFPAPGVPFSEHRALRQSRCVALPVGLMPFLARVRG